MKIINIKLGFLSLILLVFLFCTSKIFAESTPQIITNPFEVQPNLFNQSIVNTGFH